MSEGITRNIALKKRTVQYTPKAEKLTVSTNKRFNSSKHFNGNIEKEIDHCVSDAVINRLNELNRQMDDIEEAIEVELREKKAAADLKKSNKTNSGDVGSSALGGPVNSYQQDLVGSGVT